MYDLDPIINASKPDNFLEKYAAAYFEAFNKKAPAAETDCYNTLTLWGISPPELERFYSFAVSDGQFEKIKGRRMFDKNIWEALIAHPWGNVNEELGAVFMGAVKIGSDWDCNGFYVTLFEPLKPKSQPNAVYLWDHDYYYIEQVAALTLDDFAFQIAVAEGHANERISPAATGFAWRKLANRVHADHAIESGNELAFEFDEDEELDENSFTQELDPNDKIRAYYSRSQWILMLLHADRQRNWGDIAEYFLPNYNPALTDEEHQLRIQIGQKIPPSAIYLMWRYFWFNENIRLKDCLGAYCDHPAAIVRDLVTLIESVNEGRQTIGDIKNIHAVREQFLALNLLSGK